MPGQSSPNPLRDLPFFSGLPDTLLWHLGRAAEQRQLAKDEVLFREGEARQVLAIITAGAVVIEQQRGGTKGQLAAFGPGEVLGEGILLEDDKHGTSARATEPTTLVCFKKAPLLKLLKDQPALYAALVGRAARIVNTRIKQANAALLGAAADTARIRTQVDQWIASVTVLVPAIGCETAITVAREALDTGRSVDEVVVEKKLMTAAALATLLAGAK